MENKEILEGKKTDNLEATSASEELKEESVGKEMVDEEPVEEKVPSLANSPVPTEEEVKDADLEVKPEEVVTLEEKIGENEPFGSNEPLRSEPKLDDSVSSENVENSMESPAEEVPSVEENGVVEMPATKVFTQSQVNEMVGNTRTETREKTFRYIYDRYGVKDEAELDELVGNAQALDSWREKYETERASWKQTSADRDKELENVKEQVALLQSGIDSDRFEDAKFILKGKGLEVSLDNINAELATHPEWQKKSSAENENFVKVDEGNINTQKPAEPSSKISVLGNEAANGEPANLEEEFVMNRMFKI